MSVVTDILASYGGHQAAGAANQAALQAQIGAMGGRNAPGPVGLSITGNVLTATVGDATTFTPVISGGTGPYSLTLLSGTLPPGRTLSGLSVTGTYTTAGSYSYTLRATDALGAAADLAVGPVVVGAALTGFALNGSTNAALRAMLTRVKAGTGRGRIVMKGDSTTAGVGGHTVSGTESVALQFTGAAPYRPSAVLAARLSDSTYSAIDNGFVGDQNANASSVTLPTYDPRVVYTGTAWTPAGGLTFSGGNYLNPLTTGSTLEFTPTSAVTHFEIVLYSVGGTFGFAVDGSPATGVAAPGATVSGNNVTPPATSNGFTTVTVPAGTAGSHKLGIVRIGAGGATPLVRSVRGYSTATPAIDIINHAAAQATSTHQSSTGNAWLNLDALGYDAPDLTIINLGLNDATTGGSVSTFTTNLQTLVTKAKLSGDVLIVSPNAANPATFATVAVQDSFRTAAQTVAQNAGVAFCDLRAAFGEWATVASRTADNTVHPNRGFYADIGAYLRDCVLAMAA